MLSICILGTPKLIKRFRQSYIFILNTKYLKLKIRKYWKIILPGFTLLLYALTKIFSPIADSIYLGGMFQCLRILYDYTLGFLPIPFIYILLPVVFLLAFRQIFSSQKWKSKLVHLGKIILVLVCGFYLSWALNYNTTPVEQKIGLIVQNPSIAELEKSFTEVTQKLNELSPYIPIKDEIDFKRLEDRIRPVLKDILKDFGYPTYGRVRVRKIFSGSILRIRTSGIYIPHVFEGHVDGGLYQVQWPFTIAHEMSHGYGITHESDCNFFAYLACLEIDEPLYQYSASLAYWRYLAYQLRSMDNELYELIRSRLDDSVEADLSQIRKHIVRYPDLMPKYRNIIYDNYLKTHGVASGIKSYNRMILLLEAWNKKQQ